MHIDDIKRIHIADLRTKYGNQGLDIIGNIYLNLLWIDRIYVYIYIYIYIDFIRDESNICLFTNRFW